MDDFFIKFKDFFDQVKDITNVRFTYMKELYNLGLEEFPDNYQILNIQMTNQASIQQGVNKLKKNWTDDDKKVLIWLVGKYSAFYKRDFKQISEAEWIKISSMMYRRDAFHCKQKWLQMLKLPLQQAPWTKQEENALLQIIQEFQRINKGNKWSQIATSLNKSTDSTVHRNGKQCRERWNNHLNPSINRKPWQSFEDLELMKLAIQNGKKWALISKQLKFQRSENNVKNRFNCLMRKEKNTTTINSSNQQSDYEAQDSFQSDQSAEELSIEEQRKINQVIKKIEWRMKQDGNDPYEIKQEDCLQITKKVSLIPSQQKLNDNLQSQVEQKQNNNNIVPQNKDTNNQTFDNNYYLLDNDDNKQQQNTIKLQIMDFSQISQDESLQLQSCLVNKEKNRIYFTTQQQMAQFFKNTQLINPNKDAAINQQQFGNIANQSQPSYNNLLSYMILNYNIEDPLQQNQLSQQDNPQSISSYFQHPPFNYYQQFQGPSQNITQRSVLNFPPNLNSHNFQQVPSCLTGFNYHVSCYPQQQQQQQYSQSLQKTDSTQL